MLDDAFYNGSLVLDGFRLSHNWKTCEFCLLSFFCPFFLGCWMDSTSSVFPPPFFHAGVGSGRGQWWAQARYGWLIAPERSPEMFVSSKCCRAQDSSQRFFVVQVCFTCKNSCKINKIISYHTSSPQNGDFSNRYAKLPKINFKWKEQQ